MKQRDKNKKKQRIDSQDVFLKFESIENWKRKK
jgi:hypothetical protein